MKLYKLLSILNFIDNNIEVTVKDKKNNIFYKSSTIGEGNELDLVYLFKKLGGYKVTKVNFFTKSNSLVIFVKKWY